MAITTSSSSTTFGCELNQAQFELAFPEQVGNRPTFGFVTDEADWEKKKNDPSLLVPGMPLGIGRLVRFTRKVFVSGVLTMPDGVQIRHWGFEDENGVKTLPSPMIRAMGGDLVQTTLQTSKNRHTIHHHGIEPDMDNDGVGHTSFEVLGKYIYQWRAHPASSGTYFYHCHVNTPLHVQFGLFGPLVIDPFEPDPHPLGKKPHFDSPDAFRYHSEFERYWAMYSIDPVWHEFHHLAGFCLEDAGLNNFNPKYFLFGKHAQTPDGAPVVGDHEQPIAVEAPLGENILIRILNGQWHMIEVDLGELGNFTKVLEADGRALRDKLNLDGSATGTVPLGVPWYDLPPEFHRMSPAQRYVFLIQSPKKGTFPVTVKYHHWITNEVLGMAHTTVTVS